MALAALQGSWELDHSDNYEEFLKSTGMGSLKRTMAVKLGGSLTISQAGDKMKIKSVNGPKTKEREMPIGVQFEDEGPDGGVVTGSWAADATKMVGTFTSPKGKKFVMTREIQNGLLVQTMNFDGTECKRYYKKK